MIDKLSDPALVTQAFREGMRLLDEQAKERTVSIHEYAKLCIWHREMQGILFTEEIEADKRHGWEVIEHKLCGIPLKDYKIPSLGIY